MLQNWLTTHHRPAAPSPTAWPAPAPAAAAPRRTSRCAPPRRPPRPKVGAARLSSRTAWLAGRLPASRRALSCSQSASDALDLSVPACLALALPAGPAPFPYLSPDGGEAPHFVADCFFLTQVRSGARASALPDVCAAPAATTAGRRQGIPGVCQGRKPEAVAGWSPGTSMCGYVGSGRPFGANGGAAHAHAAADPPAASSSLPDNSAPSTWR